MRAVVIGRFGAPEELSLRIVPVAPLDPDERRNALVGKAPFKVSVTQRFPLDRIKEAEEAVRGSNVGRVIVSV